MNLNSAIEQLKIFNKPQIAALKKSGIVMVQDVLLHFPRKYLDFSQNKSIAELKPGQPATIKAVIKNINSRFSFRSRLSLAEAVVSDETGSIKIIWFNQAYIAEALKPGDEVFLAGSPDFYNNSLQLTNPLYEKVSDFPLHTTRLVPVYSLPKDVYPKTFRRAVAAALPLTDEINDEFPAEIINNQQLLNLNKTITASHFPDDLIIVEQAKKRLAFEEIFYSQLLAQQHKLFLAKQKTYPIKFNKDLVKTFVDSLPFKLTDWQKKASWDILQDLEKKQAMNRLLEGDVGSGKTLVAFIAALEAVSEGFQVALLAPTEILASQHYQTAQKFFCKHPANFNVRCALITRTFNLLNNKDEKKDKLAKLISEGMPGLYIGTHALLENKIKFKKLALVIIDEQHRFGVEQRAQLMQTKGRIPHLLSLSATPIPRTLQLAFFGELDVSQIKTKPAGRKQIITKLVEPQNRQKAYEFISKQIEFGRQAFVITPLIEESDRLGVKSAKKEFENLQKIFPKLTIGLMHGRLKGTEKENVMKEFLENKIQILVSTSVIEVGVDVPNASVMIIEGAERFGLSQLHQFRGRVGRAEHQSYCLLFPSSPLVGEDVAQRATGEGENKTLDRLQSFCKANDGFELAELDLKQRGFGEVYGSQQSGWNFKYFSPAYTSLIQPAREEALKILNQDLELENYPHLKQNIQGKTVHFE